MITYKPSTLLISAFTCILANVGMAYAAPAPIATSTQDRQAIKDHAFGVGLTASVAQRPFVGVDNQSTALIYLSYKYKKLYIEGLDAGYNLFHNKTYNIDILATPRFYEVETSFAEDGELDGIDKTNATYFAGISTQLRTGFGIYTFQFLHDAIESNGNEAVLQLSKSFTPGNHFTLSPSVGMTFQDKNLVDHFFGVQANEVATGRLFYAGKSTLNYNVTLNAVWKATPQVELLGQLKYEWLGNGITASPIVDERSISFITVGAVYRF